MKLTTAFLIASLGLIQPLMAYADYTREDGYKVSAAETNPTTFKELLKISEEHGGANFEQVKVATFYEQGLAGVKSDLIEAYAWYQIAASGNKLDKTPTERLDQLKKRMTPEQIKQGEERVRQLVELHMDNLYKKLHPH